jgi:TetR/AcrR family transcriptional regulator
MEFLRRRHRENLDPTTREHILEVAERVFAENGFKETTIRQICRAAKANVCLISYYFGGKDGLYKAVIGKGAQQRLTLAQSSMKDTSQIQTQQEYVLKLKFFTEMLYQGMLSQPKFFRLMMREMQEGLPRAESVLRGFLDETMGVAEKFLEFGQKAGYVRKEIDPHYGAHGLLNMILGFVVHQIERPDIFFKNHKDKELSLKVIQTIQSIYINGVVE